MNLNLVFVSVISILLMSISNQAFSQIENTKVNVSVEEINERIIFTFTDQRNIPNQNIDRFNERISSLYSTIEKITFNTSDRTFSIYFIENPEKKDLESVFSHFNVYEYTLN